MNKKITLKGMLLVLASMTAAQSFATNYYCDPVNGTISNTGTADSPWGMLQSVFSANKTFLAGDTIFLRSGYHGFPQVKGINTGNVVIMPEAGHIPTAKKLKVNAAQYWIIDGLRLSPEYTTVYDKGDLVEITASSSYITIANCSMFSVASMEGIDSLAIRQKFASGIAVDGPDCTLINDTIREVVNGITIAKTAVNSIVNGNFIQGFTNDGIRGLANDCKYEYNTVQVCYGFDDNHDDAFQSWSTDATGAIGKGTVSNVVLRGNVFISQIDPDQPLQQSRGMQGSGNFDGFFENWIIENNLIICDMYEGISLYGAKNCKIINNTVVRNPLKPGAFTPWIKVAKHKNGTNSTGNIVRNNFTSDMSDVNGVTQSNNIESEDYNTYFVNYSSLDLHLKTTSPSINAGSALNAPLIDLEKNTRNAPVDIGAYEYAGGQVDAIAPAAPASVQVISTSPGTATISWSPSTDNLGVAGYKVFTNGANPVTIASPATSVSTKGLTPGTSYTFTVKAYDAWPNESAESAPVTGTTEIGYDATISAVTASSFETGSTNVPENTLDGNLATRWTGVGDGEWIMFELNAVTDVTAIGAAFFNGHIRSSLFEIETSADGVNWTKVLADARSAGKSTAIEEFDVTNMSAKYIRYTGYGNTGNVTTRPYNSVTEFRVYTLAAPAPLPVSLLSFTAKASGNKAMLKWTTASEQNNRQFEVQRAADGVHFATIGTVKGADNSAVNIDYSFEDKVPAAGINYYRLLQIDLDGKTSLSSIEIVNIVPNLDFVVYPNPVRNTLYIFAKTLVSKKAVVTITDLQGRVVLTQNLPAGQALYPLSLKGAIRTGTYFVNISSDVMDYRTKILVE